MEMSKAYELAEALQDCGYEAEVRANYSGRGMYGKSTAGVISDARPATIDRLGFETRRDSMGMDYIYY